MNTSDYDYPVDYQYLKELGAPEEYIELLREHNITKGFTMLNMVERTGDNTGIHSVYGNGICCKYPRNITTSKFGLLGIDIATPDHVNYMLKSNSSSKYTYCIGRFR